MGSTARLSFPDLYDCEMMLKDSRLPVRATRRAGNFPPPYRESNKPKPAKKETAISRLLSQIPKPKVSSEPSKSEARILSNVAKKLVPLHIKSQSLKTIVTAEKLKKAKESRNLRLCPPNSTVYPDTPEPPKPKQNTVHMPTVPVFCKDIPKFFRTDTKSQLANVDWYETDRQLKTKPKEKCKPKPESMYSQKTVNDCHLSCCEQRIQQVANTIKRERIMNDRVKLLHNKQVTATKPWVPSSALVDKPQSTNQPVSPQTKRANTILKKTQSNVEGVQCYQIKPSLPATETTIHEELAELPHPEHKVEHWLNSRTCDEMPVVSRELEDAYMYQQLCVNKESNLAPNINGSFERNESLTPIAPSDSSMYNVTNDNVAPVNDHESKTDIAAANQYPKKFYVNKGVKLKSVAQSQAFVRKPHVGNYFRAGASRRNPPRGKQTTMADSSISALEYCKIKHDILSDVKKNLPPPGDNGDWQYTDDIDKSQPMYCNDCQIQEKCAYQHFVTEKLNVSGKPPAMSLDVFLPSVQGQEGPQHPDESEPHDTTAYQYDSTCTQCGVSNEQSHWPTQQLISARDNDVIAQDVHEPETKKVDDTFDPPECGSFPICRVQSAESMLGPLGSKTSLASTEIEMSDLTLTSEDNTSSSSDEEEEDEQYIDNGSYHSSLSNESISESLIADGNSWKTKSTYQTGRAHTDVHMSSIVPLASCSRVVTTISSIEASVSRSEDHSNFRNAKQTHTQETRSNIYSNKQESISLSPIQNDSDDIDSLVSLDHSLITAPLNSPAPANYDCEQEICEGVVQYYRDSREEPPHVLTIESQNIPKGPDGQFISVSFPHKGYDKRKTAIKPQSFELMVNAVEDDANPVVHKYNPPGQQRRRKHRTVTKNMFRNVTNDYLRDREESPMFDGSIDIGKSQIDHMGDNLEIMALSKETCVQVAHQEMPMEGRCPFTQHNPISVYRAAVEPFQNICPRNEIFLAKKTLLGKTENNYKHLTMPTISEESKDLHVSLSEERTPEELDPMQQIYLEENNIERGLNMTAHDDLTQTMIDEVETFTKLHPTVDKKEAEEQKEMYPTPLVINDDVFIEDEESCTFNDDFDQTIRPNTPYGIQLRELMPIRRKSVPVQHLEPFSELTSNTVNTTTNTQHEPQSGGFQGSRRPPSRLIKLHTGTTQGVWHPAQSTQHLGVTMAHAQTVSSARQARVSVPGYAYAVEEVLKVNRRGRAGSTL